MAPGTHQMACGNCGWVDFTIHAKNKALSLFVKYKKCNNMSVIAPAEPKPMIEWGYNHDMQYEGTPCNAHPMKG